MLMVVLDGNFSQNLIFSYNGVKNWLSFIIIGVQTLLRMPSLCEI